MSWRSWVVPAGVSDWASRRAGHLTKFDDTAGTWEAAQAQSFGYNSGEILNRVRASTEAVLQGDAAFERDGTEFPSPEYRWPVLSGLLEVAARDGELRVLDFGGSLGSVFWQHRAFFTDLNVSWGVVEQEEFVTTGRNLTQNSIQFFTSIDEYLQTQTPNVILLSSVLQYLSNPAEILRELQATPAHTVILDRTPMSEAAINVPCVQVVPQHIYSGSYPAWVFSRDWLRSQLTGWEILAEFDGIEPDGQTEKGVRFAWDGLIARRKSND